MLARPTSSIVHCRGPEPAAVLLCAKGACIPVRNRPGSRSAAASAAARISLEKVGAAGSKSWVAAWNALESSSASGFTAASLAHSRRVVATACR